MRYFSPVEVADTLGVSLSTVKRMVYSGQLPAVRVGRQLRVPEDFTDHLVAVETRP